MDIIEIKSFMKKNKITYEQLAEKTHLNLSTLKKIFSGTSKYPRIDTMQAIEKALGLNNTSIQQNNNINLKEQRLLTAFNDLIPPMQDYIIEMIEKLVAQPQNKSKHA